MGTRLRINRIDRLLPTDASKGKPKDGKAWDKGNGKKLGLGRVLEGKNAQIASIFFKP